MFYAEGLQYQAIWWQRENAKRNILRVLGAKIADIEVVTLDCEEDSAETSLVV